MIKRLILLVKIARKLASSGAIDTINQLYKLPLTLRIFFDIISIGSKKKITSHTRSSGEKLCDALEGMGTTFIKLGQFLATRPDIIGNNLAQDLEKLQDKLVGTKFILSIGRLTRQKNFLLLIRAFKEILKEYSNLKLVILGEGEDRKKIEKLISKLSLNNHIFLEGYKKNIFNYLHNCECYISSSLYEDPGFSLIESGFLNKFVIAADSKTGPTEILNSSNNGLLFKNNDKNSLVNQYLAFKKLSSEKLMNKKINLKKFSKNFSVFNHFKSMSKILSN